MSATDIWDVRFPDGRGLRAVETAVIREHLRSGRIPPGSLARRADDDDDWVVLEWIPEFAGILAERPRPVAPPASPTGTNPGRRSVRTGSDELVTVAGRLETAQLGTLGVASILREVVTALDVTLLPGKLKLVLLLGSLAGLVFALPWGTFWIPLVLGGVLLAVGSSILSQTVYVELSRNRPARWREARKGLVPATIRLLTGYLIVPGLGIAVLLTLFSLAARLATEGFEIPAFVVAGLALCYAAYLVTVAPTILMLAPILVVEECRIFKALFQWRILLRENPGRTLLYELLATGLILFLLAVPTALVLCLSLIPMEPRFVPVVVTVQCILHGLLAALALAYLVVVQVFLYLNLRFKS